jgi:hypothetical protein
MHPQLANQLLTLLFARVFLYPEDGSDTFFRNIGSYKTLRMKAKALKVYKLNVIHPSPRQFVR